MRGGAFKRRFLQRLRVRALSRVDPGFDLSVNLHRYFKPSGGEYRLVGLRPGPGHETFSASGHFPEFVGDVRSQRMQERQENFQILARPRPFFIEFVEIDHQRRDGGVELQVFQVFRDFGYGLVAQELQFFVFRRFRA